MAFNLTNLGAALNPLGALSGTLVKGIRSRAIPADFQSLLASSLASQIQNGAPLSARTTLQRALTAALAPPGTSPPKPTAAGPPPLKPTGAQLTAIIEKAGQQNEIPGTILDANPAKEPPAPQKKPAHQVPLPDAADAFARSIAQQAVASQAAQTPGAPVAAAAPPANGAAQQIPTNVAAPPAPDPFPFAPSNVAAPAPAISANTDVLSRIVARAANAGTQHAAAAAPAQPQQAKQPASVATPAASFEKLAAAINAAADTSSQSQTGSHGGDTPSQSNDPQSALTFGAPQSPAASSSTATVSAPKFAAPYTPVDVNAVIEQVVKGIVINSAGTLSQIRLRLQPEHLGEVAVKLTVNGNSISANVVAQNASVRDALVGAQPQLSRSLADAGLSLGSFSVNVSGGNAGSANEQQQRAQQQASGFKIGGWNAAFGQNEDQPTMDVVTGPAPSGPRAMVINSLA